MRTITRILLLQGHKKESNPVSAELRYETGKGNEKIIYAVFYDSLVGFSLDGADSVYYTTLKTMFTKNT